MTESDILHLRLFNQQISSTNLKNAKGVVSHFAAMQAQEYFHAKWAVGLRLHQQVTSEDVEDAFNRGVILRTHVLRPTWHFVTHQNIKWVLAATAPHVHALNAYMYRQTELDKKLLSRCCDLLVRKLEGKNFFTRNELQEYFATHRIKASGHRLAYIMMYAELEGVVCSGPRKEKQFTYALLDERAPKAEVVDQKEAIHKLARQYFESRGPATIKDFSYWSGLNLSKAKEGVGDLPSHFKKEQLGKEEIIYSTRSLTKARNVKNPVQTYLMPNYDEYGMSYKDRNLLQSRSPGNTVKGESTAYSHWLVMDGRIEGTWKYKLIKKRYKIEAYPFGKPSGINKKEILKAVDRCDQFVNSSAD